MFKKIVLVLIVAASSEVFAGGGSSIGLGNPASANCEKLGGALESVLSPEGESANCVISAWTLFKAMKTRDLTGKTQYDQVGMVNPADANCIDIGGQLRDVNTMAGEESFCVIEEWQLFRVINVITGR